MLIALIASLLGPVAPAVPTAQPRFEDPPVRIWLNNDRRFQPGDRAKVQVRADYDGYLLVLHVDPDGRLRVLFPLDPTDDNFVRGGRKYELKGRGGRESFTVDAQSGRGTSFAAVSRDAFRFDQYVVGDHWDYRALNPTRYPQDPEADLTELTRRMATGRFDYDIVSYEVYAPDRVAYDDGYVSPRYIDRSYGYDPFCDPIWDRWCGGYPYGYGSGFRLTVGFGHRRQFGRYYDPFYRPIYYDPYFDPFYDPWAAYYYPPRYYDSYYPHRPYRSDPRYLGPGYRPYEFKERDRSWTTPYRDRLRQVNTVLPAFPAQGRGIELSTPVRRRADVPVAVPGTVTVPVGTASEPRRRAYVDPAPAPAEASRPGVREGTRPSIDPRPAPEPRRAEPGNEPRLQPRERVETQPAPRAEPRQEPRAEPRQEPRPEPRRAEPQFEPRAEPRAEPRREAPPPRAEPRAEPRSAPAPSGQSGGGGGGGRRRI